MKTLEWLKNKTIGRFIYELSEGHLGGYTKNRINPRTWCPQVWDWAMGELGVRSVVDVGCGLGFAGKYFRDRGCEVLGVDGSESAIRDNRLGSAAKRHDYSTGPFEPPKPVDLVWSAEFIEHVEERYLDNFLKTFSAAQKYLMVTYATPGQGGHHHVNEQPQAYWVEKFAGIGFKFDAEGTLHARSLIPPSGKQGQHFRERGLFFRRETASED